MLNEVRTAYLFMSRMKIQVALIAIMSFKRGRWIKTLQEK